jgi:sugar O-acyltransferase (sialic acid O-acetyltransferase NeuD family)
VNDRARPTEAGDATRRLLIVGAGGFGREVAEVVRAINLQAPTWRLLGFLDDDETLRGADVQGLPVLGSTEDVTRYPDASLVVSTGHPGDYFSRKRIVERLALPASRYATLVHPTAVVPPSAHIGAGTILLPTVVATTQVVIGAHVAVMPGVVFTHDDVIGDFCTFGAGVQLAGRARVCEGTYVGSGATIREDRTVGPWALIGMGSVVTKDVPEREVWAGVPARFVRRLT